jgi:hypothetical protein
MKRFLDSKIIIFISGVISLAVFFFINPEYRNLLGLAISLILLNSLFLQKKELKSQVLRFILLILNGLVYFFYEKDITLYILGAMNSAVAVYLIVRMHKERGKIIIKELLGFAGVFSLIFALLAACLIWERQFAKNTQVKQLKSQAGDIERLIEREQCAISVKTIKIAADQNIVEKLVKNDLEGLSKEAIRLMNKNELTYLVITDSLATVLVRAHKPKSVGDNLIKQVPNIKNVFQGGEFAGLENTYETPLAMISGIPIFDTNKNVIGAVFAGRRINDAYALNLDKGNVFFAQKEKIVGSHFNERDFYSLLDKLNLNKIENRYLYKGKEYLLFNKPISSSSGENIASLNIITLYRYDNQKQIIILSSLILVLLTGYGIVNWTKKRQVNQMLSRCKKNLLAIVNSILLLVIFGGSIIVNSGKAAGIQVKAMSIERKNKGELMLYLTKIYYKTSDIVPVKIMLMPGSELINQINMEINFSSNIQVGDFIPDEAVCPKISKEINNEMGRLLINCAGIEKKILEPVSLGMINFKAMKSGLANMHINIPNTQSGIEISQSLEQGENIIIAD